MSELLRYPGALIPHAFDPALTVAIPVAVAQGTSTAYIFAVWAEPEGIHINLTQMASGRAKRFFLAGKREVAGMVHYLRSLTDLQCGDWFRERKEKGAA